MKIAEREQEKIGLLPFTSVYGKEVVHVSSTDQNLIITDDTGAEVIIPSLVSRVVSLALPHSMNLM